MVTLLGMPRMGTERVIKVFIASPNDVVRERGAVATVVDDLNVQCGRLFGISLELYKWEQVLPGLDEKGPQGLIDAEINMVEMDIVVGIFWKRFGTKTPTGETGTEHEIRSAHKQWLTRDKPRVMLYFNEEAVVAPSADDLEQMILVRRFRDEFQAAGVVRSYRGPYDFEIQIRNHLTNIISAKAAQQVRPESIPCAVSSLPNTIRGEGVAELVGEIMLTLPKRPGQAAFLANVQVSFNTNITNSVSDQGLASEAPAVIDDATPQRDGSHPIYGRMVGTNALLFESVGLSLDGHSGVIVVRVLGIRANAFALGGAEVSSEVHAFVKVDTTVEPGIGVLNPQVMVAACYPSFSFTAGVATFERRVGANPEFALGQKPELQQNFVCQFDENFPDAFKTRIQESVAGAYRGPLPNVREAETGTLLAVRFWDIPEGVTIYATIFDTGELLGARSAQLRSPDPNSESVDGPGVKMVRLQRTDNSARAVWEWTSSDPKTAMRVDKVSFGIAIVAKPDDAGWGHCKVMGTLSPITSIGTACRDAPVPRFGAFGLPGYAFLFLGRLESDQLT